MQDIRNSLAQVIAKKRNKFIYMSIFANFFLLYPQMAHADIASPFPALEQAPIMAKPSFSCPKPPDAITDLQFESMYDDADPTRSTVDEFRLAAYKTDSKPLYSFENKLVKMTNQYREGQGQNPAIAACAQKWLYEWAKGDALLGDANRSGILIRKWSLASIASAYVQIKHAPWKHPNHKQKIENWLGQVANTVVRDFSNNPQSNSRQNNHLYWAAWSVALTSYAVQDQSLFIWAMDKAKHGVKQIDIDGTLPQEMARASRALLYHVFATSPLVMLAEMGKRNGIDLYSINDGALHKLVNRSLRGLDDPRFFEERTGKTQDYTSIRSDAGLAWLAPYNFRYSNQLAAAWNAKMSSPLFNRRLGGDMTLLFEEPAAPK